jgi:class 3 adenylate cyclase
VEGVALPEHRLRFGLHWGATLYVGSLLTSGRADATALGDEMNEAARIEACAAGGRTLASKALVERLSPEDLAVVDIDSSRLRFTQLREPDGNGEGSSRCPCSVPNPPRKRVGLGSTGAARTARSAW